MPMPDATKARTLQSPEVRDRLAGLGAEPKLKSPEQFDALIKDEMAANTLIAMAAGIKPE